jgi:putative tricarboxylic transport membrane protein
MEDPMGIPARFARRAFWTALIGCLTLLSATAPAQTQSRAHAPLMAELTLVVPGTSGGGWDLTAQAMKKTLVGEGLVDRVHITRYPGAGGLVGLSQFVARHRGERNTLLLGGLVMLGGTMRDEAAVTLRDVTPIARLTGEWGVIVVPSHSTLRNVRDLRRIMSTQHDSLRWAGGALGGPDQGLVWSIASSLGIPLEDVPYYGKPGGRRVAESLVEGRHNIGTSGYAEFAPFIESGRLRVLAVAAPHRIAGIAAPTLKESGIDVSVMNWRGVFAPPGLSQAQAAALSTLIERMTQSRSWDRQLAQRRWSGTYLDAMDFAQFIDREQKRWPALIDPPRKSDGARIDVRTKYDGLVWTIVSLAALGFVGATCLLVALRRQQRRTEANKSELESRCATLSSQLAEQPSVTTNLVRDGIQDDFGEWNLSFAERDIAWFMLRGLLLKEIADLRGTSERTVRQQAQAIYRKAGLDGRSDLAGRVLERFI